MTICLEFEYYSGGDISFKHIRREELGKLVREWCPQCEEIRTISIHGIHRFCNSCRNEWAIYLNGKGRIKGGRAIKIDKIRRI